MVALLGPVDTAADSAPDWERDAELCQIFSTSHGELIEGVIENAPGEAGTAAALRVNAAVTATKVCQVDEPVADGHGEPAPQMVIATASQPQRMCPGALPQ